MKGNLEYTIYLIFTSIINVKNHILLIFKAPLKKKT